MKFPKLLYPSFLCLLIAGCDMIDYHPYDVHISGETDVNAHNIAQIEQNCQNKTTIRFVTMGDSQRWYDETDDFVSHLNKRDDIDFVIHGGDAVISAAPLFYIGNKWALILWCVIALAAMYFAAKVERIKKDNDVQTYKEIVAFCEGKRLDEIQSAREYGKRPYQKVLWFIGSAAVGAIVSYVLSLLLQSF